MLQRRRPPNTGTWNGIGGKIEPGEDPYAACIREVREEAGLAIAAPALRALLVITIKATGDLWIIYVFIAPAPEAALASSEEGELQWVDINQIATLHTPADLPLILPRILGRDEVLTLRLEYETEDASEPLRVEMFG